MFDGCHGQIDVEIAPSEVVRSSQEPPDDLSDVTTAAEAAWKLNDDLRHATNSARTAREHHPAHEREGQAALGDEGVVEGAEAAAGAGTVVVAQALDL
jgi:hypothetical protein